MTNTFIYRGWDAAGKIVRGAIRADNASDAEQLISERGVRQIGPLAVAGATFKIKNWFVGKPAQRITFFRSLASLMQANVPPAMAFRMLAEQLEADIAAKTNRWFPWLQNPARRFLATVLGMRQEIIDGSQISTTLSRRPDDFTDVEVAMVAAGEKAGGTEHVISELATFLEKDRKFRKSVTSALTYPIVVSVAAGLLVIGLGVFIVPKFVDLYAGFGVALPFTMRALLAVSNAIRSPIFVAIVVLGGGSGIFFGLRALETPSGAMTFDEFRIKVPVVGELIRKNIMISIANVTRMLTSAGENPISILDTMTQITNSPVYSDAMIKARNSLVEGRSATFYEALSDTGVFEPFYLGYVRIGQESGNLNEMLEKVAEHYSDDVAALVAQIPVIVQTCMIMILGVIVGSIVISVFSAITNLAAGIK